MAKYWKIIIVIFFALVILFFIFYKNIFPLFGSKTTITKIPSGNNSLEDYYQKGQGLRGNEPQTTTATFLAVGDIMLSRNVAATIQKANDVDLPFKGMSDILKSTDFNFANLESPIAPATIPGYLWPGGTQAFLKKFKNKGQSIIGGHSLSFAAPYTYVKALTDYKFGVLNLANNHTFDQGYDGIFATNQALSLDLEIFHEGTGLSLDEAWTPAVVTANGIKICFIGASYASINDNGKTTNNYVARMENLPRLKTAITSARSMCDFVVATMHGGTEYTRTPNDVQIKFAHAAIDDGADIVIGAHPHWVQTIERYCPTTDTTSPLPSPHEGRVPDQAQREGVPPTCPNPKYIFYSLGNFIFDQEWSRETKEGLTLKITVSKNVGQGPALQGSKLPATLNSIELIPVIIENYSTPRPATAEETKKILEKIGEIKTIIYP